MFDAGVIFSLRSLAGLSVTPHPCCHRRFFSFVLWPNQDWNGQFQTGDSIYTFESSCMSSSNIYFLQLFIHIIQFSISIHIILCVQSCYTSEVLRTCQKLRFRVQSPLCFFPQPWLLVTSLRIIHPQLRKRSPDTNF